MLGIYFASQFRMQPQPAFVRSFRASFASLRARLLLLVAVALLPLFGGTIYTAVEQRQEATAKVQKTALQLARLASTHQTQIIRGSRQLLSGLAQLPEVRQEDAAKCSALLATLLKANPLYANFGVIDTDGRLYCSALPIVGSINLADRSYFRLALESGDFSVGEYQIGRLTKAATINFGIPVSDRRGKTQAVLFAALKLDWISRVMHEAELPEGSTFAVIDRNGKFLIRYPEPENWVGKHASEPDPVRSSSGLGASVAEAGGVDGVSRLIGFTPLVGKERTGDVYVRIGIPKSAAYAEADRILFRNLTWLGLFALVAFAAAWFGGDMMILRRVNALVGAAKKLENGILVARVGPPYGQGELGQLAQTFDEMAASLQKNAAQLEYQSTHDMLTGLANRHFFNDLLHSELKTAHEEARALALFLMDLDHFKEINETIGHHNGDELLRHVTQRLRSTVGRCGVVARLGGDEFAVFQPQTDLNGAVLSARSILESFDEPFVLEKLPIAMRVSVGIALYPQHGNDAQALLQRAETAMYLAKEDKSGYFVYAPEKDHYSPERFTLLADLRRAIDENQLYLEYQPKIDIRSRTVNGVEALVRWRHPQLGIVRPDRFIGLAERSGLIRPLTFWVLNEALRQRRIWRESGLSLNVAVNISSRDLVPELPDRISAALQSHRVAPQHLELEITEGTIIKDPANAKEILTRISAMGITISIDDFGMGYSSLAYLSALPVSQIKVDKSFVINMATDKNAAVIVRSTIDLGRDLGLTVLAEGVESREVLEKLESLGCDSAQGFYISHPKNPAELIKWLSGCSPQASRGQVAPFKVSNAHKPLVVR